MDKKKIMLMTPRYTLFKKDVRRCITPIGLGYLAGFLEREGHQVKIMDIANEGYHNVKENGDFVTYGLDDEEVKKRINEFKPDVAGVSCIFSTQAENAAHTLKLVKDVDEEIITLTGGSHPTYALEDMLKLDSLDFVILGEGELPTLQLMKELNNGGNVSNIGGLAFKGSDEIIVNRNLQYVKDLDSLPLPAWHLLDMEQYFKINMPQNPYPQGKRVAQLVTSRGCTARCIFCTTTNFWGNHYRGRSAENVIEEIRGLKENYNIDEIQITDDNITLNRKRAAKIFDGMKDYGLKWCAPQGIAIWALDENLLEKMKASGCYQLTFAVESGNQYVLDNIVKKPLNLQKVKPLLKKAQDLEIKVHAFCVCGLPGETLEQMQETYDFVKGCGFDSASFFAANPLVGSELLDICQKNGYMKGNVKYATTSFKLSHINTPEFRAEQVQELVARFNKEYNQNDTRVKQFEPGKY
ncbi:MAG: radical SAM protein [Candidatus Nanoarchaeia archaeon]|nr:radical SAM protein [Candidatus Nanoarchaeia archaeon]MDD5587603.1 radical SAM protein [Candidatus Nanoarchaeia archaeon]